jgi:hypothetical protein
MAYTDLEIGLRKHGSGSYAVGFRFSSPQSDAEVRLSRATPVLAKFDHQALLQFFPEDIEYGRLLTAGLFGDEHLRQAFAQARAVALNQDLPIRLRLFIEPNALELHDLRWETLQDPEEPSPLLTGDQVIFSRYLSSQDWQPVHLLPEADLRALVLIANPKGLEQYDLEPVDVEGELARARAGLGTIPLTTLASNAEATLQNLIQQLREGHDVLYLVAHGTFVDGESWLWLEDSQGGVARVSGSDLALELQKLRRRPRLVVLVSCQTAGREESSAGTAPSTFAALGPRLAERGIPAVLAMQGKVSMETVTQFMPVFFQELIRDGQIDRAVAAARGSVRDRPDWWMPALFMRLKSGRIWYIPGFGERGRDLEKWPALVRNIEKGRCTPILGPGLAESLFGLRRDVAQRWAEAYHFPMEPHQKDDLPQVAQFLAINQERMFPHEELVAYLRQELSARLNQMEKQSDLDQDGIGPSSKPSLNELLHLVEAQHPESPYKVLADLPLPLYITTDPSSLLADALQETGKQPRLELCRWNEAVEFLPSIYDHEPSFRPSAEEPLVYYLFGRYEEPESMVLTEDDYLDYLIGVTSNRDLIPPVVLRALTNTALLFLGFRMDEWDFRVLFRSIMQQEGRRARRKYAHIAAQINPEEGRILEPERARRYLESYFLEADISIFWGGVGDFIQELRREYQDHKDPQTR